LLELLDELNIKHFHAGKIYRQLVASNFEMPLSELREIPDRLRVPLQQRFTTLSSTVERTEVSQIDGTLKMVVRLQDGHEVEAVVIDHMGERAETTSAAPKGDRMTLCVSSQVGCRLGCTFCATGTMGLSGNLCAGEILEQMAHARRLRPTVCNVVFMGMGEPLENYNAVVAACHGLVDQCRFEVPRRSVTVSTVGLVQRMHQLLDDAPFVKMAISLHAPTQELREQIVPSGKAHRLENIMTAIDEFARRYEGEKKKSSIMVSYVLIAGVNDSNECAETLAELLKDRPVIVNLIPYNEFDNPMEPGFRAPEEAEVVRFQSVISQRGLKVFHRRHHGRDIAAACGQLARKPRDIESLLDGPQPRKTAPRGAGAAPAPEAPSWALPVLVGALGLGLCAVAVAWRKGRLRQLA